MSPAAIVRPSAKPVLLPSAMTAGSLAEQASSTKNQTANAYYEHSTATRVNTDAVIVESLRGEYPQLHLSVTPVRGCDIISFANAGNAGIAPIAAEKDRLAWQFHIPPATRLGGGRGALASAVKFGKYLVDWKGKEFIIYVVDGRDGTQVYFVQNQYILSASVQAINDLLLEVGAWSNELHNEVWVFDQGYWQKSAELWQSVQKASWDDVILDEKQKQDIRGDVENFFDSRPTYEKLRVPWKRGIIYYGPPGNGKTISVKAMMHSLYDREDHVPTLYVKTLASFAGPEYSLHQIFSLARRTAPCLLVFEDLDSIVSDRVRSYFLNEVDGIRKNDGILMIGSTNHLDRLDPGISKRPSRFDRKYLFPNPDEKERVAYMKYWQGKLADNDDLDFPDKLCPAIAKITDGFSFAYMQEAMVASLLAIARDGELGSGGEPACLMCLGAHAKPPWGSYYCGNDAALAPGVLHELILTVRQLDEEDPDLDHYVLWREIKKQVRVLREELGKAG